MQRSIATPRGARGLSHSSDIVCRAVFAVESLELRQLLSGGYELTNTVASPASAQDDWYGAFVAAQGNLAVVGAPHKTIGGLEQVGEAYLIDTITGQTLHTFSNPDVDEFDQFGSYAQFVGSKLAISSPEGFFGPSSVGKVFIYDLNNLAAQPVVINAPSPSTTIAQIFGRSLGTDGTDLFVSMPFSNTPSETGRIYRYNVNDGSLIDEYLNPSPTGTDALGSVMTVTADTIYASAIDHTSPYPTSKVLAFDIATGNVVATLEDPDPNSGDPFRQFGQALEVAPNGDLFVGAGDFDTGGMVYQFDSDLNQIRSYVSPRLGTRGSEGFGAWLDTNSDGELIVGAQYTLVLDDPENPTMGAPAGSVYIFDYSDGTNVGTIDNPTPTFETLDEADQFDSFGYIFAAAPGGKIIIADPYDNDLSAGSPHDTGSVYIYSEEVPPPPTNTAPTADPLGGDSGGVRQQTLAFTGSFSDPDSGDTHQVSWNFGDGNTIAFHSTDDTGALTPTHVFTTAGSYTVSMTVKDAAGETSTVQKNVTITATGVVGGTYYVGGSTGADTVSISKNGSGGIDVTIGGVTQTFGGSSIVILGGSGDDTINVGGSVTASVLINAGAGNDSIKGGAGADILIGGDGDDLVVGGDGRDLLIGGTGADRIIGNTDDDILVAGVTSHDGDPAALASILAEWTSSRTYAERVNNIRDGSGSLTRLNGSNFLTAIDDQAVDVLTGSQGQDWFIFNNDSNVVDKVTDLKSSEFTDEDMAFILS